MARTDTRRANRRGAGGDDLGYTASRATHTPQASYAEDKREKITTGYGWQRCMLDDGAMVQILALNAWVPKVIEVAGVNRTVVEVLP